eukprot:g80264.t1
MSNFASLCPQLPITSASMWAARSGGSYSNPPAEWTCAPLRYYESDPSNLNASTVTCDCGCGAIDPDCGYTPQSCFNQTWEPVYTAIECKGSTAPVDKVFCRLESSTCSPLPPGVHFDRSKPNSWTCIPEVYYELSDPHGSFDDCDCNCGDFDPDCEFSYDNIYCPGYEDSEGVPIPRSWDQGVTCVVDVSSGQRTTHCVGQEQDVVCPQLPPVLPRQLVKQGAGKGRPPPGWTCAPEAYYESQNNQNYSLQYSCDCGCGVIDPDCGYALQDCDDQSWNPRYTSFKCAGEELDRYIMYCRLDSARCTTLPPGMHENRWTCIPDVFHELDDNGTRLNDCDCNCGSLDPDCSKDFNNLYCDVNGMVQQVGKGDAVCVFRTRQRGAECLWNPVEIKLNQSVASAVIALAGIALVICLLVATSIVRHRATRLIKASSFAFSVTLILSCGVVSGSVVLFALSPQPNNVVCALRWWVPCIAASMVFGTLFSKTFRLFAIFRIFEKGKKVPHSIRFTDVRVAGLVGSFILGTSIILALYFLIDPPFYELVEVESKGGGPLYYFDACYVSKVFVPLIFALYAVLLTGQSYLAYRVRDLPTLFNESKLIAWLLYNTVFVGLVGVVVDFMLPDKEISGKMIVRAVALLLGALTPVFVLYVPKLLVIYREMADSSKYTDSQSNQNTKNANTNHSANTGSVLGSKQAQPTAATLPSSPIGNLKSNVSLENYGPNKSPSPLTQGKKNGNRSQWGNRSQTSALSPNASQKSAVSGLSDDGEQDEPTTDVDLKMIIAEDQEEYVDMKKMMETAALAGDDAPLREYQKMFPNGFGRRQSALPNLESDSTMPALPDSGVAIATKFATADASTSDDSMS